jgi:hypothetical protein
VIGVVLDMVEMKLSYFKNGKSLGDAFTNLPAGVKLYTPLLLFLLWSFNHHRVLTSFTPVAGIPPWAGETAPCRSCRPTSTTEHTLAVSSPLSHHRRESEERRVCVTRELKANKLKLSIVAIVIDDHRQEMRERAQEDTSRPSLALCSRSFSSCPARPINSSAVKKRPAVSYVCVCVCVCVRQDDRHVRVCVRARTRDADGVFVAEVLLEEETKIAEVLRVLGIDTQRELKVHAGALDQLLPLLLRALPRLLAHQQLVRL